MSCKRLFSILLVFCIACKAPSAKREPEPVTTKTGGPKVHATVLTIESKLQPGNRTLVHTLTVAGDRARSDDELDSWRLFDLKENRVIFVDDIARTYRVEPYPTLLARRRAVDDGALPEGLPAAKFATTSMKRTLQGIETTQSLLTLGAYRRELWIGTHPSIPAQLFAMMIGSDSRSAQLAGLARNAESAMLDLRGFPLAEHAELAFDDNQKLVLDRAVTQIVQKDVAAALVNVPSDYKQIPSLAPPPPQPHTTPRRSVTRHTEGAAKPVPVAPPTATDTTGTLTSTAPATTTQAPGTATSAATSTTGTASTTTAAEKKPAVTAKPTPKKAEPKKAVVKKPTTKKTPPRVAPKTTPKKSTKKSSPGKGAKKQ